MSQFSPDQLSELAALQQKLQDAAASVAALRSERGPVAVESQSVPDGGEIRSYYFSPEALSYEKTLQQEYKVADFNGLLHETYTRIMGLAKVMIAIPPHGKLNGSVVAGLGGVLDQISQLVWRMTRLADKTTRTDLPTA